jgi:hypothetical protein
MGWNFYDRRLCYPLLYSLALGRQSEQKNGWIVVFTSSSWAGSAKRGLNRFIPQGLVC